MTLLQSEQADFWAVLPHTPIRLYTGCNNMFDWPPAVATTAACCTSCWQSSITAACSLDHLKLSVFFFLYAACLTLAANFCAGWPSYVAE